MHLIPARFHGALDYGFGVLLIFLPSLLRFQNGGAEDRSLVILGMITLFYSLLTRFELGLFRVIPFKAHLPLDFLGGVFLVISPWVFGFSERVWAPHVVLGVLEIGAALMSQSAETPARARSGKISI